MLLLKKYIWKFTCFLQSVNPYKQRQGASLGVETPLDIYREICPAAILYISGEFLYCTYSIFLCDIRCDNLNGEPDFSRFHAQSMISTSAFISYMHSYSSR